MASLTQSQPVTTLERKPWWTLSHLPSSWGVTVCGSKVPTSLPRSSTRMVSDRPISSSRSAEMRSTASPARRAALMWPQICAWAYPAYPPLAGEEPA